MDFDVANDTGSGKPCTTGRAIGELSVHAAPWIFCNRAAIMVYRFVCLVAVGIRAGSINHALSVKLKLFSSRFRVDWKVAEEFFDLRGNMVV